MKAWKRWKMKTLKRAWPSSDEIASCCFRSLRRAGGQDEDQDSTVQPDSW